MPEADRKPLFAALLGAMRPIASMLLRFGIGYREFAEVCKAAFVAAAADEYGVRGRPTNVSRVAAMTGLSRKEVRRLREGPANDSGAEPPRNPAAEVLHRWFTDARFLDATGQPRPLAYDGDGDTFATLVRGCAGDIPPGAIRAELRRVDALTEGEDGRLVCRQRYLVPGTAQERLIEGLTFGLRTLALAVAHNTTDAGDGDRWFQRTVINPDIPAARLEEVSALLQRRLTDFSAELDDVFAEVESEPSDRPGGQAANLGVGLYFYRERGSPGTGAARDR